MFSKLAGLGAAFFITTGAFAASNTSAPSKTTTQSKDNVSDQKILNSAQDVIENKYRKFNVIASVNKGTVTLRGTVENEQMRSNIESDIRKLPGVKSVNNMIKINANAVTLRK